MVYKLLRLILIFGFSVPSISTASQLHPPKEMAELKYGISLVFKDRAKEAEKIFQALIDKDPEHPAGYFYMAGMYAENITIKHDWSYFDKFNKYAELAIEKSEKYIKAHAGDPAGYFFLGNIHGYYALLYGQKQNMFSAFMSSLDTVENLNKVIELDPELYDAYYGLGTIYYYASKKFVEEGGIVGWVIKKFITDGKDRRAEGLMMLNKAMVNQGMTSGFAASVKMWISMGEGDYRSAEPLAMELMKDYPLLKRSHWALGRVMLLKDNCSGAKKAFTGIAQLILNDRLSMKKFPEVTNAVGLSSVCSDINKQDIKTSKKFIQRLRVSVERDKIVWMEYPNKLAVKDSFKKLLKKLSNCLVQKERDSSYMCGVGQAK